MDYYLSKNILTNSTNINHNTANKANITNANISTKNT